NVPSASAGLQPRLRRGLRLRLPGWSHPGDHRLCDDVTAASPRRPAESRGTLAEHSARPLEGRRLGDELTERGCEGVNLDRVGDDHIDAVVDAFRVLEDRSQPVRTTSFTPGRCCLHAFATWRPLSPGMARSVSTRSKVLQRKAWTARTPSSTAVTAKPRSWSS